MKKNHTADIKMKLVTAIISQYNSGDWIENRINNLLNSDINNDLEIICVNANSPDQRDEEIPRKMGIKYIHLSYRASVYEAWNIALRASNAKYASNANSDDLIAPDYYSKLTQRLESDKNIGLAYCSWYVTDKPNQIWGKFDKISPDGDPGHYRGDLDKGIVGHFPLWRTSLHKKIGYFNEEYRALGDAEWWARIHYIAKSKLSWVQERLACYLYRHGENLWHKSINEDEWAKYHKTICEYKLI